MSGALRLLGHSIKRARTLVIAIGVLLGAFQVLLIQVAGSIQASNAFEQIGSLVPPFVRQLMGPSFMGLMSFSGIVSLGYFHLAVMGSLVGMTISLATWPTSEIETGFMDLILARPLARHWIITRTILLIVAATVFALGMMMAGTWSALSLFASRAAEWPTPRLIWSLALNLGALVMCWGGVALAIGSVSRRRGVAGGLTGVMALTTFLLDYIARAWEPAAAVGWLSPFRYYSPLDIVMGRDMPAYNLWVLFGVAVAGFALAYFFFARRDI